ncbi:hypothetical protein C8R43DRAFT_893635 [Mycena crocata]|nr:hypothetical protein C8R43DRAFT_893635 [Mycena crocata]
MASTPHQRVVDDTDPSIQYADTSWFAADPATLRLGNFGPIYNDTSKATSSTNSSLTFRFNGTSIKVAGTLNVTTNANNVTDPTWECLVDNKQIPKPVPKLGPAENNWVLCEQPVLGTGAHDLTIHVTSAGQKFYLDYLVYTPARNDVFETAVLLYNYTDPAVSLGTAWKPVGGALAGMQTSAKGGQMEFDFLGTRSSMYGVAPSDGPLNGTTASYTLDGGRNIKFNVPAPSSPNTSIFNELFFATANVANGRHKLVVTYGGNQAHTPLAIQHFYVTNSTTQAISFGSKKSSHTGAIVGGVIGGILFLLIQLAMAVCLVRKRRRRRGEKEVQEVKTATALDPFLVTGVPDVPHPQSGKITQQNGQSAQQGMQTSGVSGTMASTSHGAPSDGDDGDTGAVVVRHEDSGVRWTEGPVKIVELPPGYSQE